MVNTRNTPATLDDGVRQWVTDHVDSVTLGINEKLDNMLLQFNYLVTDVNRLKGGEGSSRFSRMSKLEFPKFYGEDVHGWMFRVKQFFSLYSVHEEDKIKMEAILKIFGHVNEDPIAELKNLRYETSMNKYQSNFERLLNLVDITESQSISMFIAGLPATIELNVRMFKPKSLSDAFSLANLQEATLVVIKQRNTPILPTPRSASTWNVNKNTSYAPKSTTTTLALLAPNTQIVHKYYANETSVPKKLLSQKEFADKRAKNLCFYCDKKYVPGHKCEGRMFSLEIKGIEGEECLE
ncbi:hypothetical protein Tco_0067194 [Tanacetum coccineum]